MKPCSALIEALDLAVGAPDRRARCRAVEDALVRAVVPGGDLLEPRFLHPDPAEYARRLLHLDPGGRYSVVVMVWGRGQGTPLHDHAGTWCVECVYRGRIRVASYRFDGADGRGFRFTKESEVLNGVGEAGALIPPREHHVIENAREEPSATMHVYGGEMTWCHAFLPEGNGTYRRVRRELGYTD